MQYHQIIIFFHRPWLSKSYIQPRSPRQGPGYHHARRMCVESATAVARLLQLYEKHYTFRRMNNQVVAIIFSAALMLLFVTVSSSGMSPDKPGDSPTWPRNADMVAYLNLCFRALDELGQSFENAKRTRDYLVTLQRRWQSNMGRSGSATKRQISSGNLRPSVQHGRAVNAPIIDSSRKKSRLSGAAIFSHVQSTASGSFGQSLPSHHQNQHHPLYAQQPLSTSNAHLDNLDWIHSTGIGLSSETQNVSAANDVTQLPSPPFPEDPAMLAGFGDVDGWWASGDYNRTSMPP